MKLQLTSKTFKENVKYISTVKDLSSYEWNNQSDFFIKEIQQEVVKLDRQTKKKFKRVCQTTIATFVSTFALVTPALAESPTAQVTAQVLDGFMPKDLAVYGLVLIGVLAMASTILAILLMQLAGGMKMLRKSKDANEWMTDIMKGYTIVIVSPVLILTIAIVAYLLFGSFKWFVKPF